MLVSNLRKSCVMLRVSHFGLDEQLSPAPVCRPWRVSILDEEIVFG